MKSSQTIKLFQVQDLTTTLPVTPAWDICQTLGYELDWVEEDFSSWGLHRMYIGKQLQMSYFQATMFAKAIPDPQRREQHQIEIDQSFFAHFVAQNPKLHG